MHVSIGRVWTALLVLALAIAIFSFGDKMKPLIPADTPFQTALTQLGILFVIALLVERTLEVFIKVWRQGAKSRLEEAVRIADGSAKSEAEQAVTIYRSATQRRALLAGLTLGIIVSLSGVRVLGAIFDVGNLCAGSFQAHLFQLVDILVTGGLVAGGSKSIHELMALIESFLNISRSRVKQA